MRRRDFVKAAGGSVAVLAVGSIPVARASSPGLSSQAQTSLAALADSFVGVDQSPVRSEDISAIVDSASALVGKLDANGQAYYEAAIATAVPAAQASASRKSRRSSLRATLKSGHRGIGGIPDSALAVEATALVTSFYTQSSPSNDADTGVVLEPVKQGA